MRFLDTLYCARRFKNAAAWARQRAGRKITNVSNTVRKDIAKQVSYALSRGLNDQDAVDEIARHRGIDEPRAKTIWRTEKSQAINQSRWNKMQREQVRRKHIDVYDPCPICVRNYDNGPVGIDEPFPSGHYAPPFHPNCRCKLKRIED